MLGKFDELSDRLAVVETDLTHFHPLHNPWISDRKTSVTSDSEREAFREELRRAYQPHAPADELTCMLTGATVHKSLVAAAHIWPARARSPAVERWFGLPRGALNTYRNGLLMLKSVEEKFDDLRLGIACCNGETTVQVLDKRLRTDTQVFAELRSRAAAADGVKTSFAALHGATLPLLAQKGAARPYNRLVTFHFASVLQEARRKNWPLPDGVAEFGDREKVLAWLRTASSPDALWPDPPHYAQYTHASRSRADSSSSAPSGYTDP